METKRRKMVPPDGGWGWVVLVAVNIINFFIRSMDSVFGLLFGDLLKEINIETTGAAIITSGLDAVIHISGIVVGPIAKTISCRKICVAGGILCAIGLLLTYPARSMVHLFITYSVIYGIGLSLTAPATFIVVTHYFMKRRGIAFGFSVLGAPIGMMVIPHLIRFLLEQYGFRGAVLVSAGMMLHIVIAACLFQPAKWHFVLGEEDAERSVAINEPDIPKLSKVGSYFDEIAVPSVIEVPQKPHNTSASLRRISGVSFVAHVRKLSLASNFSDMSNIDLPSASMQFYIGSEHDLPALRRRASAFGHFPSYNPSPSTYDEQRIAEKDETFNDEHQIKPLPTEAEQTLLKGLPKEGERYEEKLTVWKKFVIFFDLGLLKDPVYINLSMGIALLFVGDQNFKMVVPFFYDSIGYGKREVALFLSIQACGDIIARVVLPPIFEKIPLSKRTLFMISLALLGVSRSVLAEQTDYTFIIICLVVSGFCRAGCFITFNVILSQSTTFERLPAAYGLHMVSKGILSVIVGPILGYVRDTSRSYSLCIHLQTVIFMLCCVTWLIEYIIVWMKSEKQQQTV